MYSSPVSPRAGQRATSTASTGSGSSGLPPPPGATVQASYSQSLQKSMTIEEMRHLHQRALRDAEAKRTELRLVLASRYRELVGSSDEVIKMKERAQELNDLVHALPKLMEKLTLPVEEMKEEESRRGSMDEQSYKLRSQLSTLPRIIHRALDRNEVHKATSSLIDLFSAIASNTDEYPLANSLSKLPSSRNNELELSLKAQVRMIFLQMQTLPRKIQRISEKNLLDPASYGGQIEDPEAGAYWSAASLASLDLLGAFPGQDRSMALLDKYFESKARLLKSLLDRLAIPEDESTAEAESIITKIILILQHDVIVHPYEIFVLRKFPGATEDEIDSVMGSLPLFDPSVVKSKCSKFLSAHLPLIQAKVKSVLVTIAGTTASALGQIRQSLYDKTDGEQCMTYLNSNPVCTWDTAVAGVVDPKVVLNYDSASMERKFSLWGILFSHTFSSLVHSLLTTSFQSVHSEVVAALRASIGNAPSLQEIQPHDAHRNTLRIATNLDKSLIKVSDDAHELLVHAEEREESEKRLRASLYVQTCEIMGRLLAELRRMVQSQNGNDTDAVKDLIVGRLCYLMKFRLTSLPTLLGSQPSTGGQISYIDMQSAFELADDDEDGLISYTEATRTADSAFSGTSHRGSEMLRETLLLTTQDAAVNVMTDEAAVDISLNELILLCSRGLKHSPTGVGSAIGAIQSSLDNIIEQSFAHWASVISNESNARLEDIFTTFVKDARELSESEWKRAHHDCGQVPRASPFLVSYILDASSIFTTNTGPADTLVPVPSTDYASSQGIELATDDSMTFRGMLRLIIIKHCQSVVENIFEKTLIAEILNDLSDSAALQLLVDIHLMRQTIFRSKVGEGQSHIPNAYKILQRRCKVQKDFVEKAISQVRTTSDLLVSPFLGEQQFAEISSGGELTSIGGPEKDYVLFDQPISSTRRFVSLPVQTDRSVQELRMRNDLSEDKATAKMSQNPGSGNVLGLGFLSSMLKKK